MTRRVASLFTSSDLDAIKAAVVEAESHTAGEIVPYVVNHCDEYEASWWRCAALLSTLALAISATVLSSSTMLGHFDIAEMTLAIVASGVVGWLAGRFVDPVRRVLAGHHTMERRVAQRAAEAFVGEEVFATHGRTGILIFVSLFEHRVMVIGDTGINAKVERKDWDEIVEPILKGILAGIPARGLIEGIRMSGQLLARHGIQNTPGDADELPDDLRTSES